jgi:hypothetical protein
MFAERAAPFWLLDTPVVVVRDQLGFSLERADPAAPPRSCGRPLFGTRCWAPAASGPSLYRHCECGTSEDADHAELVNVLKYCMGLSLQAAAGCGI